MNRQIARLGLVGVALVAALIVATTYWQTWASAGLADRQDNEIQRVAQFSIKRGLIRASDGTILASNRIKKVGGQKLYLRRYPQGGLFSHVVGYSTQSRARAGLESSMNDYLTGANRNLDTVLKTTLDRIRGATITGNDLWLTMRPGPQRLAMRELAGKCGSVVALDPRTGKVLVMASRPTYDPNLVEKDFARINNIRAACRPAAPLLNRATDGLYTPGSTFKVVTASAALDSGRFTPQSRFFDPGYCIEYGKQVRNAGNPEAPETFGSVDLITGLEHSINSVFCNIGKAIGAGKILGYAKRYGFYEDPPLETPANERSPSGLYKNGELFRPSDPRAQVDPGRLAFGQERMLATPLQMAMVAAGVGNKGVVMEPFVVDRITNPNGGVVTRTKPRKLRRAVSRQTAQELTQMMEGAVQSGTGTAAQIPGVAVAGKTGTAETGIPGRYTSWFISFAPANAPRVAVAVVLQDQTGFGGQVAAPIAKDVMQAILAGKANP
ncbi:MAG TPA: penicillin-binding protein 2 [Gaiellaceae bacterium]|nr:penicillin-binding protein 2 [Gaiellaceae bacterium]